MQVALEGGRGRIAEHQVKRVSHKTRFVTVLSQIKLFYSSASASTDVETFRNTAACT